MRQYRSSSGITLAARWGRLPVPFSPRPLAALLLTLALPASSHAGASSCPPAAAPGSELCAGGAEGAGAGAEEAEAQGPARGGGEDDLSALLQLKHGHSARQLRCTTWAANSTVLGCPGNVGPVVPKGHQCHCAPGLCVDAGGQCVSPATTAKARVVPVSHLAGAAGVPLPERPRKLGLTSSGGGGRALSFFLGCLRALTELGVMSSVDVLSTVSGSSWASSIYMFAQRTDTELLGNSTEPQQLTLHNLQQKSSDIGAAETTSINRLYALGLALHTPTDQLWAYAVREAFLAPFGLAGEGAYLAPSKEAELEIKAANPQLADAEFYTPAPNRPGTYMILATLLAPNYYQDGPSSAVGLQVLPGYIGSPFYPNSSAVEYPLLPRAPQNMTDSLTRVVGGGFVEAFAFNGASPTHPCAPNGGAPVEVGAPKVPFSLGHAVAASSDAPGAKAGESMLGLAKNLKAEYWPVTSAEFAGPQEALTYQLGDGGNIDNSGLLSQLQWKVPRIIWVANTYKPLNRTYPWDQYCNCGSACLGDFDPIAAGVVDQVLDKFGYGAAFTTDGFFYLHNQVFDQSEVLPLSCRLWDLVAAGKPAVVDFQSTLLENPWWGIEGGDEVDITLVYLENVTKFNDALPEETQQEIAKGQGGMFANWPIYKTTLQNPPEVTSLTMQQVNLLAALGEYVVKSSAKSFTRLIGNA